MSDEIEKPGVILSFGDDLYYVPADGLDDALNKIGKMKEALVGKGGPFEDAVKVEDERVLNELDSEEMRNLLNMGMTIRPFGR